METGRRGQSMSSKRYTYIVVGSGAAGAVVANRLSADPSNDVLLLEAGGRDWNPLIHIPVGFTKLTTPDVNWGFSTVPSPRWTVGRCGTRRAGRSAAPRRSTQ